MTATLSDLSFSPTPETLRYYFGYGLEADPEAFYQIVGSEVPTQTGVMAVRAALYVQSIEEVPNRRLPELGGASPREVLEATWDHVKQPFSSYVLREGRDTDQVEGTVYELSPKEYSAVIDWDMLGQWRHALTVMLDGGSTASTLTISSEQKAGKRVRGTNYDPFLVNKPAAITAIQRFRQDYEARNK